MMLHENIIPRQFMFDIKNDCTNSLLGNGHSGSKIDIYNTYNYHHYHQERFPSDAQVLDLSRRCDSVETRKTPSPFNSSLGTASPIQCGSPPTSTTSHSTDLIQNKPIFSHSNSPPLSQAISSIYPICYPEIKKEEVASPPPSVPTPNSLPAYSTVVQNIKSPQLENKNLPQMSNDPNVLYPGVINAGTTGAVSVGKTTRPFNAFPRDPLLVAAHFAASDVLFDKTTMERYSTFRKRALDDYRLANGGNRIVSNPKMRRTNHRTNGQQTNSECEDKAMESSDNDSSYNGNGSSAEGNSGKNDNNGSIKDEAYFERRRKNNAAAKKSRDRRRIKEDEIALRAAFLERQNIELLCQIDALKKQLALLTKV